MKWLLPVIVGVLVLVYPMALVADDASPVEKCGTVSGGVRKFECSSDHLCAPCKMIRNTKPQEFRAFLSKPRSCVMQVAQAQFVRWVAKETLKAIYAGLAYEGFKEGAKAAYSGLKDGPERCKPGSPGCPDKPKEGSSSAGDPVKSPKGEGGNTPKKGD